MVGSSEGKWAIKRTSSAAGSRTRTILTGPGALLNMLNDRDTIRVRRATEVILSIKTLELRTLKQAFAGKNV